MNAPFSPSADFTFARNRLQDAIRSVERLSAELDDINHKRKPDPDGYLGARKERQINRRLALIDKLSSRLLGVDITRFDRARGVAL